RSDRGPPPADRFEGELQHRRGAGAEHGGPGQPAAAGPEPAAGQPDRHGVRGAGDPDPDGELVRLQQRGWLHRQLGHPRPAGGARRGPGLPAPGGGPPATGGAATPGPGGRTPPGGAPTPPASSSPRSSARAARQPAPAPAAPPVAPRWTPSVPPPVLTAGQRR